MTTLHSLKGKDTWPITLRTSFALNWENETHKLKRSAYLENDSPSLFSVGGGGEGLIGGLTSMITFSKKKFKSWNLKCI